MIIFKSLVFIVFFLHHAFFTKCTQLNITESRLEATTSNDVTHAQVMDCRNVEELKANTTSGRYYVSKVDTNSKELRKLWVNFANLPDSEYITQATLSVAYRKAVTVDLNFTFPFYSKPKTKLIVTSGGFLFLGDTVHAHLAATQYIAPLMANFDTALSNSSLVQYMDNGTDFVVQWNNVMLRDQEKEGSFSFQVTLKNNGDILFVYKDIPIPISEISTQKHPVKVGIADAYIVEVHPTPFTTRKNVYEYSRFLFNNATINRGTIITLTPLRVI